MASLLLGGVEMVVPPDKWRCNLVSLHKQRARWRALREIWTSLRQSKFANALSATLRRGCAAFHRFRVHALAFACWLAIVVGFILSPWPPLMTLRHIASAPNCAAAQLVGLAPAREGEPGY